MEQLPHGLEVVLGTMPLLGAAVLLLVVAALATDRDRLIVPGTVIVVFLVAGLAAAMEYGPKMAETLASRPEPVATAPTEPSPALEPGTTTPAETPGAPPTEPAPEEPAPPEQPAQPEQPVPVGYTPGDLVSVPANGQQPTYVIDKKTGRRVMVVNPGAAQPGQPVTAPTPVPTPAPQPVTPVPAQPTTPPGTRPTYTANNTAPALPSTPTRPTRPMDLPNVPNTPVHGGSGTGTLVVKIGGPLVETAQIPSNSAHVMAILDGKEAHARGPTRSSENRKDNDPSQPVLATTYFWENVTFTFNNVEAGYHVLMIDSSLDSQGQHRGAMTGSGQDKNDYNGSVEIKAGQTTVVEFGAKNWMSGQLSRIR